MQLSVGPQGGCCGGEDRLGSSPYSARDEQERARRMRGCISQLSSSFFSSPACVLALPAPSSLGSLGDPPPRSLLLALGALASCSPLLAPRRGIFRRDRIREQLGRPIGQLGCWRRRHLRSERIEEVICTSSFKDRVGCPKRTCVESWT